jgi:hypothetical protein
MAEELPTARNKIYPDQDDSSTFGIGSLFSKIVSEGFPANVRAYLETTARHVLGLPNATWGNEVFTENQLELLRERLENRESDQLSLHPRFFPLRSHRSDPDRKSYEGPFARQLRAVADSMYNDDWVLATSLGGVQVREDDENYYISDAFDFSGKKRGLPEAIQAATHPSEYQQNFAYHLLRYLGPTISQEDSGGEAKSPPMFELTIPKEGKIPRARVPSPGSIKKGPESIENGMVARGSLVDKPLYEKTF